jgi:hypothetical protein
MTARNASQVTAVFLSMAAGGSIWAFEAWGQGYFLFLATALCFACLVNCLRGVFG